MRPPPLLVRTAAALVVGCVVGALAQLGGGHTGAEAAHGACFSALRLLRHAVATFAARHGHLPGEDAALIERQLTMPRTLSGVPDPAGPLPGLLDAIPTNPFTGSAAIVVVPEGVDAVAFAAAAKAGWAFLAGPGHDRAGPLPVGMVLPCGSSPAGAAGRGVASVQEIAFEIEDFQRWR